MLNRIKRGDVYLADLSPVVGNEQGGVRPVLVIQNNVGNEFSNTVIVACITSRPFKDRIPTHVILEAAKHGFQYDSVAFLEQLRTIDKSRLDLTDKITHLDEETMRKIDERLVVSVGLSDYIESLVKQRIGYITAHA